MKKKKTLIFILLLAIAASLFGAYYAYQYRQKMLATSPHYLTSDRQFVTVWDEEGNEEQLIRGILIEARDYPKEINERPLHYFEYDGKAYYADEESFADDRNQCVREKEIISLRDTVLYNDYRSYEIAGWIKKNTVLKIEGYDALNDDGTVNYYLVSDGNSKGYIAAKYLDFQYRETSLDASRYAKYSNYGGGDPTKIAYYPKDITSFEDNVMPDVVKALYVKGDSIAYMDQYLAIADDCGINAFVLDIKDCFIRTQFGYESEVVKKYAPTADWFCNTYEDYKNTVQNLRNKGYYVIGRITAFKDVAYAADNFDESLQYNGDYFLYAGVKWPSVYSRRTWEYDVALALEAAEMGFNEIQFDYIRCPERIIQGAETHNLYDESYLEAVMNFLRYASDQLHQRHVYMSGDVFGETSGFDANSADIFVTTYGQFWPAISNAVDAISSMPYPDHFPNFAYGINEPWEHPYELMYSWGRATNFAQQVTYDPARVRTWIQAQNSDTYGTDYDVNKIKDQIRGLEDAGVNDGYMTWSAASSIYKYTTYKDAFR